MTAASEHPPRDARGRRTRASEAERQVRIGDQQCPRCGKSFTLSYWSGDQMIQARCLSCDLKWPLPDVV
jgi:NMD protein affecting ribosome stability and mRNA decay